MYTKRERVVSWRESGSHGKREIPFNNQFVSNIFIYMEAAVSWK
jgi:hypothetical protein